MKSLFAPIRAVIGGMYWVACLALVVIMLLTVSDIILRRLGTPIEFTYEVVVLLGAIVIGFAIPQTSLDRTHVIMDFLLVKLPASWRKAFSLITRCLGIVTFAIIAWNVIVMGTHLHKTGQETAILQIPEYPIVYGIGFCCFLECAVLLYDLLLTSRGENL